MTNRLLDAGVPWVAPALMLLVAIGLAVFWLMVFGVIHFGAADYHYYLTCEPAPVPVGRVIAEGWRCR